MQVTLNLQSKHPVRAVYSAKQLTDAETSIQAFAPRIITFGGNKTKKQVIVYAPESQSVIQKGGVGTVAADFGTQKVFNGKKYETLLFMPYYNGEVINKFNDEHSVFHPEKPPEGKFFETRVRYKDGKPIFVKGSMVGRSVEDLKPNEFQFLEEVSSKQIQTASGTETAKIFRILGDKKKNPHTYLIFTQGTGAMRVPYGDGVAYSSAASTLKTVDPYAINSYALTEMLPDLEAKGIKPAAIVLNDPQTAYAEEFIARKAESGSSFYKGLKTGYLLHNPGDGYQQNTSHRAMFSNLATPEQIELVENSEVFKELQKKGLEDELFKRLNPALVDEKGETSGLWLAMKHREAGTLDYMGTVSPGAAKSYALGEGEANGVKALLKKLYMEGKFAGVLNGLDSDAIDPTKVAGLEYYKEIKEVKTAGGQKVTLKPFETFNPQKNSLDSIIETKQRNAANLFERINLAAKNPEFVIGAKKEETRVLGTIDKNIIATLKKQNKTPNDFVKIFVSWGRGDEQKGLDVTINAFRKYMHDAHLAGGEVWKKAEKSVLVLGGDVKGAPHLKDYMYSVINEALADPLLKGKFAFMDGFAPNAILSNAGNLAVFPSRFAPCELTDHEARSYGCHTLVTGLEGLDDKNFDLYEGLDDAIKKGKEKFKKSDNYQKLMNKAKKEIQAKLKKGSTLNPQELEKLAFDKIFESEKARITEKHLKANKNRFTGFKTVSSALTDVLNLNIDEHPVFSKFPKEGKEKIKEAIEEYKYERNKFFKKWTNEFSNEVFHTDKGDVRLTLDQVKKKVAEKWKQEYRSKGSLYKLEQRAKDAIVSQELAEKMKLFSMLPPEDLKQGMRNNFNMAIQWRKNFALQRINQNGKRLRTKLSAGELYERFIAEAKTGEKKPVFKFSLETFRKIEAEMKELLKKIDIDIDGRAAKAAAEGASEAEQEIANIHPTSGFKRFLNKETFIAAAGVAAICGLVYYLFKPASKEQPKSKEISGTYIA